MYDNSDFFNDDLNFILALSKEEYRYNDLLFDKMQKVMDNVRSLKGVNKTIALEAIRVYDDLNIRVNKFTDEISTVNYSAAMEEMSKGMMALIAAGIAAFIAMLWKIIGVLTGDSSSSSGGGGGGGGGASIEDIKKNNKAEEAVVGVVVKAAKDIPVLVEEVKGVVSMIDEKAKNNTAFSSEINSPESPGKELDDLYSSMSKVDRKPEEYLLKEVNFYLNLIKEEPRKILDEGNESISYCIKMFNKIYQYTIYCFETVEDGYAKGIDEPTIFNTVSELCKTFNPPNIFSFNDAGAFTVTTHEVMDKYDDLIDQFNTSCNKNTYLALTEDPQLSFTLLSTVIKEDAELGNLLIKREAASAGIITLRESIETLNKTEEMIGSYETKENKILFHHLIVAVKKVITEYRSITMKYSSTLNKMINAIDGVMGLFGLVINNVNNRIHILEKKSNTISRSSNLSENDKNTIVKKIETIAEDNKSKLELYSKHLKSIEGGGKKENRSGLNTLMKSVEQN